MTTRNLTIGGVLVLSIGWWAFASDGVRERAVALAAVSLMSMSIGVLVGFLFSSYEGEQASVGKVRDWLIGAITGIVLVKATAGGGELYAFFARFKTKDGTELEVQLLIATAVTYATLGFLLMYVLRELSWNPKFRAARKADELAKSASVQVNAAATADAGTTVQPLDASAEALLVEVEEKNLLPQQLSFEALLKTGRAYYAKSDYALAIPYLRAALRARPSDPEIATLLASALAETGQRTEGVKILRQLAAKKQNVPAVYKLLGYHLLWFPEELDDAIHYSTEYLKDVPNDSGALFNLVCAYSQKYGQTREPKWRDLAVNDLKRAINMNPMWKERARSLLRLDFAPLQDDPEFREVVGLSKP